MSLTLAKIHNLFTDVATKEFFWIKQVEYNRVKSTIIDLNGKIEFKYSKYWRILNRFWNKLIEQSALESFFLTWVFHSILLTNSQMTCKMCSTCDIVILCGKVALYELRDFKRLMLMSLILFHTVRCFSYFETSTYILQADFYRSPTYSNHAASHYYLAMQENNIPSATIKVSSYYPRREKYRMQGNGHHYWVLLPGKHNTSFLFWLTLMIGFFLVPWQACQLQLLWRWDPPQAK